MNRTYNADSLFIIQSLGNAQLQSGEDLYNSLKSEGLFSKVYFHDILDRKGMMDILNYIDANTGIDWKYPIIHFECHGYDDGSGLALRLDGISWLDIALHLTNIKKKSNDNLLISISACYGLSFLKTFSMFQSSYCSAILAVDSQLLPLTLVSRFAIFYKIIFQEGSAITAVNKMNEGYSENDGIFYFYPVERLINVAISKTIGLVNDPEKRRQWAVDLMKEIGDRTLTVDQVEDMLKAQSRLTIIKALAKFNG